MDFDAKCLAVGTDLQFQVVRLGICPKCHEKTLDRVPVPGERMDWHQCRQCFSVYVDETQQPEKGDSKLRGGAR